MSKYYRKVKRKRKEADKLWQKACVEKYGKLCEVCGQPMSDVHHFIPKSLSSALRLDIKNGVILCRKCHFSLHSKSDPAIIQKIIKRRGEKWYNYVQEHRRDDTTTSLKFYETAIKKLKKEIEG